MTRSRTLRTLALAVTAAAALSACSAHPGSAATVGSDSISESHVDDVAQQLCTARVVTAKSQGQASQPLVSRAARQAAVNLLVDAQVSEQYGAAAGAEIDPEQLAAAVASSQSLIAAMPARLRPGYTSTLREIVGGQLLLLDVGKKKLAATGTKATQEQTYDAGLKLRNAWATTHSHVSVDPRFGRYSGGQLKAGGGSLSVPVSSSAVAGSATQPNTAWVGALPASQKCG